MISALSRALIVLALLCSPALAQQGNAFGDGCSPITIGTTEIACGGTTTTLAGLASLGVSGTISVFNGANVPVKLSNVFNNGSNNGAVSLNNSNVQIVSDVASNVAVQATSWNMVIPSSWIGYNNDTKIFRDAAGILAQRNGTNAQSFRVANTWASSTSYEYGIFGWQTLANTLTIGTSKGSGGGSARPLQIVTGDVAALTISTAQAITLNAAAYANCSSLSTVSGVLTCVP